MHPTRDTNLSSTFEGLGGRVMPGVGRPLRMVEVKSPVWCLKDRRCDCCTGEGILCFETCPRCGWVVLVCDEVGRVYPQPGDLTLGPHGDIADPSYVCPNCGDVAASDFRNSTAAEIQQLGFRIGEYH